MAPALLLVAYYRVSTEDQERSGLGLEAQRAAVRGHAKRTGARLVAEYTETASGRLGLDGRPQLAAAVGRCRREGATLAVAKLDRLARRVHVVLALLDSALPVVALDILGADYGTAAGWMTVVITAVFAEFELRRIQERIRDAIARKRARGEPLGAHHPRCKSAARPRHRRKMQAARAAAARAAAAAYRERVMPLVRGLRAGGLTLAETAAELNRRGVLSPTGRQWAVGNLSMFVGGHNLRP